MARKCIDRTGEHFVSNQGCSFFIVEYINGGNVTVEFQDEHKARVHTSYYQCKKGTVANPYHKSLCGVACVGLDKKGNKLQCTTREYALWSRMINRCYNDNIHKSQPSYKNATVCERWLCYANFLEDLPLIENYELWLNSEEKICLDKDLKGKGNKIYSLDTCIFVTENENVVEANIRTHGKKIKGTNIKTGEVLIFNKIGDASNYLNITTQSISYVLRGKGKSAGGYHWQYVDDNDE